MGRRSIFRDKENGYRIQAVLSEQARAGADFMARKLRGLYVEVFGVEPTYLSDADTVEYTFRGHNQTRSYLVKQRNADRTNNGPNGGNRSATTTSEIRDERTKDYQKGRRPQSRA